MLIQKRVVTKAEFDEFVRREENWDKNFELIAGEIVEKMPTFGYTSGVGARVTGLFVIYLLQNPIAHLTNAEGVYEIDDENNLAPDAAVILKSRLSDLPTDSFIPIRPDLVVEVVSASDLQHPKERIHAKRAKYLEVGVPLVLYVFPNRREVEVSRPGAAMQVLGVQDSLDCSDVLPGFTLAVRDIFPD